MYDDRSVTARFCTGSLTHGMSNRVIVSPCVHPSVVPSTRKGDPFLC